MADNLLTEEENYKEEIDSINKEIAIIEKNIKKLNSRKDNLLLKKIALEDIHNFKKSEDRVTIDLSLDNFQWSKIVRSVLIERFKLSELRIHQLQTINALLCKKDTILLAPTGGGKSLCYQLPALLHSGLTLVIAPLISLMMDQVWIMRKFNVNCEILCSNTETLTKNHIYNYLKNPNVYDTYKLLYITPEQLSKNKRFMTALQKCYEAGKLNLIAIDEVHCVSQWGHDFRPDYKYLSVLKELFPNTTILGATATATTNIIKDVKKILKLDNCVTIKASFNRPNLYYHILNKPKEKSAHTEILLNLLNIRYKNMSGIIYTFTIKDATFIADELVQNGISALPYYASLNELDKMSTHKDWLSGKTQVIVATVAFGMGIDKPDVRFVIHHTISKSMFNYYQETGRAGRDGKRAECILFYGFQDIFKITTMVFHDPTQLQNAYSMILYCIKSQNICRRELISKDFNYIWDASECNNMCDNCLFNSSNIETNTYDLNIKKYYDQLCDIIERAEVLHIKLTPTMLLSLWFGKKVAKLKIEPNKNPPQFQIFVGEQILIYLIIFNYLKEDFQYTAYNTISYIKKNCDLVLNEEVLFSAIKKFFNLSDNEDFFYEEALQSKIAQSVNSTSSKSSRKRKKTLPSNENNKKSTDDSNKISEDNDIIFVPQIESIIEIADSD